MHVALARHKAHKGSFIYYLKTVKPSHKHTHKDTPTPTVSRLAGIVPIATPLYLGRDQLVDLDCKDKKGMGDFGEDQTKRCPTVQH